MWMLYINRNATYLEKKPTQISKKEFVTPSAALSRERILRTKKLEMSIPLRQVDALG